MKFLAILVGKRWEAVRTYFYRNGLSKNDPKDVREYLLNNLKK